MRPGKLYLSDYLIINGYKIKQNTMIIAPTGSGKTHFILNDLCPGHKCLYLCDNSNLKESVLKNPNTREYQLVKKADVEVMTYKKFGMECIYQSYEFVSKYEYVIADEIHNLIDYQKFSNDTDLARAIDALMHPYDNTKIVFFTATPYYLECIKEKYPFFMHNFKIWDLYDEKTLKRYIDRRKSYISNIMQLKFVIKEYEEAFKYGGMKCMVYTNRITEMKLIEDIARENGLNPISIWSTNASEEMTNEQLIARAQLIETGYLKEPYNMLIINRAFETGVNIYDEDMTLVVVNTTNFTQQRQARGRVRHDVDLLVLKDKTIENVAKTIIIPAELLDVHLPKCRLQQFIEDYGLKNEQDHYITVNKFLNLIKGSYEVGKKEMRLDGKRQTVYKITMKE